MPLSFPPRSSAVRFALPLCGVVAALTGGEFALREADFEHPRALDRRPVWSEARDRELRRGDGLYKFDSDCMWSLRPGALLPWTDGARVNPDGFRGPQLPLDPTEGVLRIATMGGAVALGVGVTWSDTFGARLVQILGERGVRAEVLCAAAEEHTVTQHLEAWRTVVRHWRPRVLICSINGFFEASPAPGGRTDAARIEELRLHARAERGTDLRDRLRLLHLGSWLVDAADGSYWREREYQFIEQRLAPGFGSPDWPGQRRTPYDDFVVALRDLIRECAAERTKVILLTIPRSPELPVLPVLDIYQRGAAEVGWAEGAILVDGRNAFLRTVVDEYVKREDLFLDAQVPSECGHLTIAQVLANEILARRSGPR